jgi:hypothetical protein
MLLPLGLALCASGCFRMVNVDPLSVRPDEDLTVRLTPEASDRVAREFGTVGPRLIGHVFPVGSDSLAVDAWLGQIYSDALAKARLVIPVHRGEVIEVQRRELSVKRTVLASAAGAGMLAMLLSRTGLFEPEGPDGTDPGPPPPPEESLVLRVLRFTVTIPFHIGR